MVVLVVLVVVLILVLMLLLAVLVVLVLLLVIPGRAWADALDAGAGAEQGAAVRRICSLCRGLPRCLP